jgi:hypothetical protein
VQSFCGEPVVGCQVLCGSGGRTVSVRERCPFTDGVRPSYIILLAVTRGAKNAVGVLSRDGPAERKANQGRNDGGWPGHIINDLIVLCRRTV